MISSVVSSVLISLGLFFMGVGMLGLFRFKPFYSRVLITAKIETMGFLTIMAGLIVRAGLSYFSLKIILIAALFILTNPLSTHAISRSAYISGVVKDGHDV